jgi:hypothetical protein
MAKNVVTFILLLAALSANGYFLYERSVLKDEINLLKERESQIRKEAEADKSVWSALYKDCIDQNNALMARLKDAAGPDSGSSSK